MEDNELIKRCQNGDKAAFHDLIYKYHPFVFKFLVKLAANEQMAEDLAQEVFLKLIRSIDKYDRYGQARFSTYLLTMAKNTYIDYLRKEKRWVQYEGKEKEAGRETFTPGFEDSLVDKMYCSDIREQMEHLAPEQRIVLELKYIEGLTLKEIGEILELEPKTVKSRIHNGMTKLKKMVLRGEYGDG